MKLFNRVDGAIVNLTTEGRASLIEDIKALYEWCACYPEMTAVTGIEKKVDTWFEVKKPIIELLSKSPFWNEEKLSIEFDKPIHRLFDKDGYRQFIVELVELMEDNLKNYEVKADTYTWHELSCKLDELYEKKSQLEACLWVDGMLKELDYVAKPIEDVYNLIKMDYEKLRTLRDQYYYNTDYIIQNSRLMLREDYNRNRDGRRCFGILKDNPQQFLSAETAAYINEKFPKFKAKEGQKTSRVVNKLAQMFELDKTTNKQAKYYGWGLADKPDDYNIYNYAFAQFADACNPFDVEKHVFISVHPIDFLSQSWGTNWTSCHTPDKNNKHGYGSDTGATYHGMYSSGPVSYMLDGTSIVFYILGKDAVEKQTSGFYGTVEPTPRKEMRQMFHIGKEKIVQGRLYPYDQTDRNQYATYEDYKQYREIVQSVIAEAWGVPNLWTNKKGTSEVDKFVVSYGTHYRDYASYSNCNISFLKDYTNNDLMEIGHNPFCPICGKEHSTQDNVFCYRCENSGRGERRWCEYHDCYEYEDEDNMVYINYHGWVCENGRDNGDYHICDECNNWFYSGDGEEYSERDERHFCCSECAERAGYVWNQVAEDWLSEDDVDYSEIDREDLPNYDNYYYNICWAYYEEGETTIARKSSCFMYDGEWYGNDTGVEVDGEMVPEWLTETDEETGEVRIA